MLGPGTIIDNRYKMLRLLNSDGASADIWLAIDLNTVEEVYSETLDMIEKNEKTGLVVAIKIYRPENFLDVGDQKFRDEFKIAFNCHNSNLLQPINFSIDDKITYLVLPYCKNGSTENYIGKFYEEDVIWKFIMDVANGLSYLHAHVPTIIHNDIKPANILIGDDGNYLITDFGISLNNSGTSSNDETISNKGTPAYMAPECFYDNKSEASDIWSLGATLYELIEGIPPYGENGGANQIKTDSLPPFNKGVSSEIKKIIYKCLSIDPNDRFTAHDLYKVCLRHVYSNPGKKNTELRIRLGSIFAILTSLVLVYLFLDYKKDNKYETENADSSYIKKAVDTLRNKEAFHNITKFSVNGVPFEMAYVKGGKYEMGTRDENFRQSWKWDFPPHMVSVDDFLIGTTEVTQKLWESIMGHNPSQFVGDSLPVENVSWNDCQKFIKSINRITGKNFRLPTEAEWEYAARGGEDGDPECKFSGDDNINAVGWYIRNSNNKTNKVAQLNPNQLGIYDMSGNVREWVQDWYDDSYEENTIDNPKGPKDGIQKVYRGGAYYQ